MTLRESSCSNGQLTGDISSPELSWLGSIVDLVGTSVITLTVILTAQSDFPTIDNHSTSICSDWALD